MNTLHSPPTYPVSEPIKRAYEYLTLVRAQFLHNREVYDAFVEVMGRFKEQSLERMEVIERVAELFAGHHHLLSGFNQFLPKGYRLEPSDDPLHSNEVVIVTPEGRRQRFYDHHRTKRPLNATVIPHHIPAYPQKRA